MVFKAITIENYCPTISYSFKVKYLNNTQIVDILVVSIHGKYRDGSAGRADAGLIKGIVDTGVFMFKPSSVLIDFSDLEYNWGDNIDMDFEEIKPTRFVILVSEKCRTGLSSLLFWLNTDKDIVDNKLFFDNFEEAISELKKRD